MKEPGAKSTYFADKLLSLVSEKIPDIQKHIVEQTVLTPESFQAITLQAHHSFGGCAPVMHKKAVPDRTPIEGFWFIGSQSESGAGINNVVSGARRVAMTVLKESAQKSNQ
ncbi:MAG: hypothetical protein R2912_05200 [Eubacteriales bacterium]